MSVGLPRSRGRLMEAAGCGRRVPRRWAARLGRAGEQPGGAGEEELAGGGVGHGRGLGAQVAGAAWRAGGRGRRRPGTRQPAAGVRRAAAARRAAGLAAATVAAGVGAGGLTAAGLAARCDWLARCRRTGLAAAGLAAGVGAGGLAVTGGGAGGGEEVAGLAVEFGGVEVAGDDGEEGGVAVGAGRCGGAVAEPTRRWPARCRAGRGAGRGSCAGAEGWAGRPGRAGRR